MLTKQESRDFGLVETVKYSKSFVFIVAFSFFLFQWGASFAVDENNKADHFRPWIGVMIQPLTDELKKKSGAKVAKGIYIVHADKEGPAYKAGLRHGDVIINAGASSFGTTEEFVEFIQSQRPDKIITFVVIRDGKRMVIQIKPELNLYPFSPPPAKPDCREGLRLLEESEKSNKKN